MGGLEIRTVFKDHLNDYEISRECAIYGGRFLKKYIYLFVKEYSTLVLVSDGNLENPLKKTFVNSKTCSTFKSGSIVGNEYLIFLLESDGALHKLAVFSRSQKGKSLVKDEIDEHVSFSWEDFDNLNFTKVLAITDACQEGFVCLGIDKNGRKQLKIFKSTDLDNCKEFIFSDLNATPSNSYYLKAFGETPGVVSVIISDRVSGRTYLCQNNDKCSVIYCSKLKLISAIWISAQNCFLLCFENGKLFIHFITQAFSDCVLFLNKRILCIEKCFCNEGCLLWSDGAILHHTEINFDPTGIKIRNFKIQNNIAGAFSFMKAENSLIAATINNIWYSISVGQNERKELVPTHSEILSQIYEQSLKITDIQQNIKTALYYTKCKEMIQNNEIYVELSCEGNFLIVNYMSEVTLKKELWKIEIRMSNVECGQVKVVQLDTDIVKGMIYKFENPFTKSGKVRVYLTGNFEWEILSVYIGTIGDDHELEWKKNLKKKLDEIKLMNQSKTEKN